MANLLISSTPLLARAVVLGAGAYWVIQGRWTLGSLLAFQSYLGYVFDPAQFLSAANFQLQGAKASLERISNLFKLVPEENVETGRRVNHLRGEVEFRKVSMPSSQEKLPEKRES